jgi:hypothetical protein
MADVNDIHSAEVAVIGGGPAGLMAAIAAASAGANVVLIEKKASFGMKLLATGGGRCNVTNTSTPDEMIARFGKQGRFTQAAFALLDSEGLRAFLHKIGVETHVEEESLVFPTSNSARAVRDALERHCQSLGVKMLTGVRATKLEISNERVTGVVCDHCSVRAKNVIITTGGKSYPEFGAEGDGYKLAQQAGHTIVQPAPALVPLVTYEKWPHALAGMATPSVSVRIDLPKQKKAELKGDLLFTHNGLSGPAALDISGDVAELLQKQTEVPLTIDFTPGTSKDEWVERMDSWRQEDGKRMLKNLVALHLPAKLAAALVEQCCKDADIRVNQLTREQRDTLSRTITSLTLTVTGTAGFAEAMVTRGGVSLKEVNSKMLESRLVAGLFFAGEVLNLDGPCGGYNLQWAFSSGMLAGTSAARQ